VPHTYQEILDAGFRRGEHFQVETGNLENISYCLLVAPHGGLIEPGTAEVTFAVARLRKWAYYLFKGQLPRQNWSRLHLSSTCFDEPTLLSLLEQTQFALTVHGEGQEHNRNIYVGGLYAEGRKMLVSNLNADLADLGITACDAFRCRRRAGIAGRSQRNICNRGSRRQGLQVELSRGVRSALFKGLGSEGLKHPNKALDALARSIDRTLSHLLARA